MNFKNFIIGVIVGGIVYFLLGWLFYGILFTEIYPPSEKECMLFIALGSLSYAVILSYVINHFEWVNRCIKGAKVGAILGLFIALYMNFFMYSGMAEVNYKNFGLDVALSIITGAIVGAVIAGFARKKVKE